MCGIIGYSGPRDARKVLIEGLRRLEYRGYDSWGIVGLVDRALFFYKQPGEIGEFKEEDQFPEFHLGMAHTRWATHGEVNEVNAHPQFSCNRKIAVVHNGIIENFQELRRGLEARGHKFVSDTDTEVIPHLIEEALKDKDFKEAVLEAISKLKGSFAFVVIDASSGRMAVARMFSPLTLGLGDREIFVASDPIAFVKYTKKAIFLEDGDLVFIHPDGKYELVDFSGNPVERQVIALDIDAREVEKGQYEHFTLKEIEEQYNALMNIYSYPRELLDKATEILGSAYGIFFVAAGSSYFASLVASYVFSKVANRHVNVVPASEFPYYKDFLTNRTLVVAISQSGETADVLEAVRAAKEKRAKIMAVVNVINSSLARMSDWILPIYAGPEIGVAATKSFSNQLALLSLLAYSLAGRLEEGRELLRSSAEKIKEITTPEVQRRLVDLANRLKDKEHIFLIGRGVSYPVALEGALKIKELSYIHADGFPGGELKHGHIALIEDGTPVIVISPEDETKYDILSNAMEVRSRGAFVIGIASENNEEVFDYWVEIPKTKEFSAIVSVVPMQLLAYYLAVLRGANPDKPRNLAKSVTVK